MKVRADHQGGGCLAANPAPGQVFRHCLINVQRCLIKQKVKVLNMVSIVRIKLVVKQLNCDLFIIVRNKTPVCNFSVLECEHMTALQTEECACSVKGLCLYHISYKSSQQI